MCGICGIINNQDANVICKKMMNRLVHRGPDDNGLFSPVNHIALGSVRLSIIDIEGGQQPLFNEEKNLVLVFNGEIFNYRNLRKKLVSQGHQFKTRTDSEVLLHLYEEYGHGMVDHLRGQFAFVLWDNNDQTLFLARDRFGIKPLWYAHRNGAFIFASEPSALLESELVDRKINKQAIHRFLSFRAVPQPDHIFQGIKAIPAGHWAMYSKDTLVLHKYWTYPVPHENSMSEQTNHIEKNVEDLLTEAIQCRLESDVPVGLMLSGGLDSSLIAALLREKLDCTIQTFFLGFQNAPAKYDEREAAQTVASKFKTDHLEHFVTEDDIFRVFPDFIKTLPQPCSDGLQKYLLSEFVSKHVKVVLSGSGGDELFAGYDWFQQILKLKNKSGIRKCFPHFCRQYLFHRFGQSIGVSERMKRLSFFLHDDSFLSRYNIYKSLFKDEEKTYLCTKDFFDAADISSTMDSLEKILRPFDHLPEVDQISWLQIETDLKNIILLNEDVVSMAHSLEMRVPYLDHLLAEYVGRLYHQRKMKNQQTKYIIKAIAEKFLPYDIVHRPKHGFIMPVGQWLKGPLKPLFENVFSRESIERRGIFQWQSIQKLKEQFLAGHDSYYRIWNLMILELWLRVHVNDEKINL